MSQTIENRIVEMQFENKQFESGVQESLSTLDKLKKALKFDDAAKNLQDFSKATKNFDLNGIGQAVEQVGDKFSTMRLVGIHALNNIVDAAMSAGSRLASVLMAPLEQIKKGGWSRAMNIEEAKFQLEGLGIAWEEVSSDIDYAVSGTAYGLDVAAKACSQLSASGIQAGNDMKTALRGISGVAAMGNTAFENIADIFTKAAGNGRVMADELNRVSQYGINASATLADFFNTIEENENVPDELKAHVLDLTKGMLVSESDIREFASKSELDFKTFAYAMDDAFGEHAKEANKTFFGALSNIKAALSRIGAEFATPFIQNAIPVLNKVREIINAIKGNMGRFFQTFSNFAGIFSDSLVDKLESVKEFIEGGSQASLHFYRALQNIIDIITRISWAFKAAIAEVFPVTGDFRDKMDGLSASVEKFTEFLVPSKETTIAFKNILVAVLNVLKAVGTVVKALLPIASKILSIIAKVVSFLSKIVVAVINFVSQLDLMKYALTALEVVGMLILTVIDRLISGFIYLKNVLSDTSTVTGRFAASVRDTVMTIVAIVGGTLFTAVMKIKELLVNMFTSGDPLKVLVDSIHNLIEKFKGLEIISKIIAGIKSAFESLVSMFSPVHKQIDQTTECVKTLVGATEKGEQVIEETFEMAKAYGSGPAMSGAVKELSKSGEAVEETSNKMTRAQKIFSSFGDVVHYVSDKLHGLRASSVILAIFAARLVVMAYNTDQLIVALGTLTRKLSGGFLNMFKTPLTKWAKFTGGLLQISAAIGLITLSMTKLSEIPVDKLKAVTVALATLVGLTGGIALIASLLTSFTGRWGKDTGFNAFALDLFMLSASIFSFIAALKLIDSMKLETAFEDFVVLGSIMLVLGGVCKLLSKISGDMAVGSVRMLAFAGAILIVVKALDMLSRINFTSIKENYKEILAVLAGFGLIAMAASTVGLGAVIGLIAFFLGFINLNKVLEALKGQLQSANIGEFIMTFCGKVKNALAEFLSGLADIYEKTTEIKAKTIAVIGGLLVIINWQILHALNKVTKYIRKLAISAAVMTLAIIALMYAYTKMSQACEQISAAKLEQVKRIFWLLASFVGLVTMITAFGEGDVIAKEGKNITTTTRSGFIKHVRKLMLDMAILILAIVALIAVTAKLTPEELKQAMSVVYDVMGYLAIITSVLAVAFALASYGTGKPAGLGTFLGAIALLGAVLGSIVVLMNYFKDFDIAKQRQQVIATFATLIIIAGLMAGLLAAVGKLKYSGFGLFGGLALAIAAIGGVIFALVNSINEDNISIAREIMLKVAGFVVGIMAFIVILVAMMRKTTIANPLSGVGLGKLIAVISGIVAIILAISGALILLNKNTNAASQENKWVNLINAGAIVGLLAAFMLIMKWTTALNKLTDITTIGKALLVLGSMTALFGALSAIFTFIVDKISTPAKELAKKATIIGLAIAALEVLALAACGIGYILTGASGRGLMSAGVGLGLMTAFTALFWGIAEIFTIIDGLHLEGLEEKVKLLKGLEVFLGVFAVVMSGIGFAMGEVSEYQGAIGAAIGAGVMGAVTALFEWLVRITTMLDKINLSDIGDKIKVLKDLEIFLGLFGAALSGFGTILTSLTAYTGAIGSLVGSGVMTAVTGVFHWLSYVCIQLNDLQLEGLSKKLRLVNDVKDDLFLFAMGIAGLGTILGGITKYVGAIGAAIGAGVMAYVLTFFYFVVKIFDEVDKIKDPEAMNKKVNVVYKTMWKLYGFAAAMIGAVIGLPGVASMAVVITFFWWVARIFDTVDQIKNPEEMNNKVNVIYKTMWKLFAFAAAAGIIGPILAASIVGLNGMVNMVQLMVKVAGALAVVQTMNIEGMRQTADDLLHVMAILALIAGLSGVFSPAIAIGFIVLAGGLVVLGQALSALPNVMDTFSNSLIGLSDAITIFSATAPGLVDWLTSVSTGISDFCTTLVSVVPDCYITVTGKIGDLVTEVASILTGGHDDIYNAAKDATSGIEEAVTENTSDAESWGTHIVEALASGLRGAGLTVLMPAVGGIVNTLLLLKHSKARHPDLQDEDQWLYHMMENLVSGMNKGIGLLKTSVDDASSTIKELAKGAFEAGEEAGSSFEKGIKSSAVGAFENTFPEFTNSLKKDISDTIDSVVSFISEETPRLRSLIENKAGEIGTAGGISFNKNIKMGIKDALSDETKNNILSWLDGAARDIGGTIVDIVDEVIPGALTKTNEAATQVGSSAATTFHDVLTGGIFNYLPGISSVAKTVGDTLGIDLENGFEGIIQSMFPGVGNMFSEMGDMMGSNMDSSFDPYVNDMYSKIYGLSNALASLSSSYARGLGTLSDFENQLEGKINRAIESKNRLMDANARSGFQMADAVMRADNNINKLKGDLKTFQDAKGFIDDATESINEFAYGGGGGGGKGKGGVKGATEEIGKFAEELEGVLEGQMNIFQKFEKKEAMSKEELLENMRSQIRGMTEWAADMQKLAARGLDQGLYQELAMMGPQGAEYVGAFASMTAEELAEANNLWAQSLVLPKTLSNQIAGTFSGIGTDLTRGLIGGIQAGGNAVSTEMKAFAHDDVEMPFRDATLTYSPSRQFMELGHELIRGLSKGISTFSGEANSSMRKVGNDLVETARAALTRTKWFNMGRDAIIGLADGLLCDESREALKKALDWIKKLLDRFKNEDLDEHSPSKLTEEWGRYLTIGLANGIVEEKSKLVDALSELTDDPLTSMRETIAMIGQQLSDEIEDPVITPVLDLTNVQSGMKTLSNMFSTTQALNASASLQNEQSNGVSKFGTTFIQNNYSPKALSRTEIYRQTKNQFSAYREAFS